MDNFRGKQYWNYWQEIVKASVVRNTVEIPVLLEIADFEGKKCLDAGAGVGRIAFKINGFAKEIVCIDESKAALQTLKAEIKKQGLGKKIKARLGNIRKLPFKDNSFDIVYSLWTIYHLKQDWQGILEELNRVCRKGGAVIVCFSGGNADLPILESIARNDLKERKAFKGNVVSFLKKINGNSFFKIAQLSFWFKSPEWALKVFSETFLRFSNFSNVVVKKRFAFLKKHSSKKGCVIRQEAVFAYSFKK
ncbi:MAG: class I SAM-dependent methyltransferase [Candidatus Diapherotrites archaeon]|nr:class I SAM-dependent methyltransferase [Candidatus Diapherotrites archaeon]